MRSQIQVLNRTQQTLPTQSGHAEQRTHDYVRHGHHHLVRGVGDRDRAYPEVELHLVMGNYTTHKQAKLKAWLDENPRIHVHFIPTSGSWLNMVEVWFGIIERERSTGAHSARTAIS